MSKKSVSYEQVVGVIQNILSTGIIPSIEIIQRSFEKEQREEIISHFRNWKKASGWGSKYNKDMKPEELVALIQQREEDVERTLSLVRSTLEATNDGIIVVNNKGQIVDYNENFTKLWGLPSGTLEQHDEDTDINMLKEQLVNPEQFFGEIKEINEDAEGKGIITDLRFKDGRVYERYSQPHRVGGEIVGRVWSLRDVTKIRQAEAELKLRQRAIEASPSGVMIFDLSQKERPIIYVNPAFESITGYKSEEVLGKGYEFLYGDDKKQQDIHKLEHAIKEGYEECIEVRTYRKDGKLFWSQIHVAPVLEMLTDIDTDKSLFADSEDSRKVIDKKIENYVAIISDITERKAMEKQLVHQATHDALTNLPNRLLLIDRLRQAILYAKRAKSQAAVLFLDLDHFKLVNDGLGHGLGDKLLQKISSRLSKAIRITDTVSRIGGDEFIIIVSPLDSEDVLLNIVEKLLSAIRKPLRIDRHELNISASLGVSIYPKDGYTEETLLRHADTAMYQVKDEGRNGVYFYTRGMNAKAARLLKIQNNLHLALAKNEFELHFQPIVSLKESRVEGVESLIRWHNEELGDVSPVEFIHMAEDTGLIVEIGEWVMRKACQQLAEWDQAGIKDMYVSINVSGRQLYNSDIVAIFKNVIKETKVDPGRLMLEITESILMEHTEEVIIKLNGLRDAGARLAIDDFGTGYSSLCYLKDIPVNTIKIDRSLIVDIDQDRNGANITLAIIAMSKSLKMAVLAEGVETKSELDFLMKNDCEQVQGYYYSKPLPEPVCTKLLKDHQMNAKALIKK